jgi:hypothetical protein
VEFARIERFADAEKPALEAVENGSLCAQGCLSLLHDKGISEWAGADEATSQRWVMRFETGLRQRASEGNGTAMFVLGAGYHSRWGMFGLTQLGTNDSLAGYWLSQAAEAGNPTAPGVLSSDFSRAGDFEAAESLLRHHARRGSGRAYELWANSYLYMRRGEVNPRRHFEIVREAVDQGAENVSSWIPRQLERLESEAASGNREDRQFLAIADSLELRQWARSAVDPAAQREDSAPYLLRELCAGL